VREGLDVGIAGEGDREKMRRRLVLQNLKVCDFYDKGTHRCLADGTSICLDPHLVKEEECETAREASKRMVKNNVMYRYSDMGLL
jgi:hypothetical protein